MDGKIVVRHRGGGHKQANRILDWSRKAGKGIVIGFEYDPKRNVRLAKLYHKGNAFSKEYFSFILAPAGLKHFQELFTYSTNQINSINLTSTRKLLEPGDFVHAVEAYPTQGSLFARSAGTFCQIRSFTQNNYSSNIEKDNKVYNWAKIRLPSGSHRLISVNAYATYGHVSLTANLNDNLKKAGRSRWLGKRPSVRGVARNPIDHPHGGGQGKTSGGRPSVTFKAWPTKGQPTRSPKRKNKLILN